MKKLSRYKYIYSIFIPFGVIIFALGWVFFWFIVDLFFNLSGVDSIDVTDIALIGFSLVVAIALGCPIGFVLKRLYIWKHILLSIIATSLIITGAFLGEIIHYSILIYREFGIINIMGTIRLLPYFWKNSSEGTLIIKFTILICSAFIIYIIAKAKKPSAEF